MKICPILMTLILLLSACQPALPVVSTPTTVGVTPTPVGVNPTSQPSPTGTPTPAAKATVSLLSFNLEPAQEVMAKQTPFNLTEAVSPDGQWRAWVKRYDCLPQDGYPDGVAYELLMFGSNDGSEGHPIADQLQSCGGLGAFGLGKLEWSPNSRYLYYTTAREGGPDGAPCGWTPDLWAVEASTEKQWFLSDGPRSPDGKYLAAPMLGEIAVWDINEGLVGRVLTLLPERYLAGVAWSPDSRSIAYLKTTERCMPTTGGKSAIVRLDVPNLNQSVLLDQDSVTFVGVQWNDPGVITLTESSGAEWIYNLSDGSLGSLTPLR